MASYQWTQADVDAHNAKLTKVRAPDVVQGRGYAIDPPAKGSKYRNVRTVTADGEKFDSIAEADFWIELKVREQAGEIRDLKRQVRFGLYAPDFSTSRSYTASCEMHSVDIATAVRHYPMVSEYVADFVWTDGTTGRYVVADKKGHRTQMYKLKRKWLALQSGIDILEV